MTTWNAPVTCLILSVGPIVAEAQKQKNQDTKPKGIFVTTVGTHTLYGGRLTLRIEEKAGKLDSYVTRNQVEGEPKQPDPWGPLNPRISKNADWFIYAESADEVWWFDGDKHLYLFPYNHHRPDFSDGGIYQLRLRYVLKLAPKEVLDRLPGAFKEARQEEEIDVSTTEITANDLAYALDLRWWSFQLELEDPTDYISFRPCELRRRPDGTWHRRYLDQGFGERREPSKTHRVAFFVPEAADGKKCSLKINNTWHRFTLARPPDFEGTYTNPKDAMIINGCLVMAIQEKDPTVSTGKEEDILRVIGLQVATNQTKYPDEDPESTKP